MRKFGVSHSHLDSFYYWVYASLKTLVGQWSPFYSLDEFI